MEANSAGPSIGLIRRPRRRAADIAEMYSRLRAFDSNQRALVEATSVTMQEMRGDVSRLDSNQQTQKKFFEQQLHRVEGLAQSAIDNTTGLQNQVESVRQQTKDMHISLQSMNRRADLLTTGLAEMLQGFRDLKFEMPNHFDDWLKIRIGHEGGIPSTISGEDLRKPWTVNPSFPSVTSLPPQLGSSQNVAATATTTVPTISEAPDGDDHSSPPSTRPSSAELFKQYLNHPSSSQDNLIVVMNSSQGGEEHGGQSSDELPPPQESIAMRDDIQDRLEDGEVDEGGRGDQEQDGVVDGVVVAGPLEEGGQGIQEQDEVEEVVAGAGVSTGAAVGETTSETLEVDRSEVPEAEMKEDMTVIGNADGMEDLTQSEGGIHPPTQVSMEEVDATTGQVSSKSQDIPAEDSMTPPQTPSSGPAHPLPLFLPDPSSTPPPNSPSVVRSQTVEPPPGMLAANVWVSPPSSQSAIPSPTPQPNPRLLAIPPVNRDVPTGPMTRSRSRSRSASASVPTIPSGGATRNPRTPKSKPQGRR